MPIDRTKFRPESYWSILDGYLKFQFLDLREFITETNSLFHDKKREIEWKVDEEKEKYKDDPEALNELYDFYSDDYQKYDSGYISLFLNSSFVTSTSLFEYQLKRICQLFYKRHNITVNDIKGEGNIGTYKKYLEKIVGIDLDAQKMIGNKSRDTMKYGIKSFTTILMLVVVKENH